jgi:LAO/AO transport system kinase
MTSALQILQGNRLALAKLLTQIENNTPEGRKALVELYPSTGRAYRIGVTGAPGTGKSSLVNQLALYYRRLPADGSLRVAVVAVDPSSPFTGGAILGDRVRMRDLLGDPGVFIRSMASRGSLGGLAAATTGIVQALDAAGFDIILIETVGAGQAEVDIARLAHTTLVIEAPGLGDDIQAIKAGILEIADVLVINKADRPGVENTERALRSMLQLGHPTARLFKNHAREAGHWSPDQGANNIAATADVPGPQMWIPPVIRTVATEGQGIPELAEAIEQHRLHLQTSGELTQRELARLRAELDLLVREALVTRWRTRTPQEHYLLSLERIARRELSPWQAVEELIREC